MTEAEDPCLPVPVEVTRLVPAVVKAEESTALVPAGEAQDVAVFTSAFGDSSGSHDSSRSISRYAGLRGQIFQMLQAQEDWFPVSELYETMLRGGFVVQDVLDSLWVMLGRGEVEWKNGMVRETLRTQRRIMLANENDVPFLVDLTKREEKREIYSLKTNERILRIGIQEREKTISIERQRANAAEASVRKIPNLSPILAAPSFLAKAENLLSEMRRPKRRQRKRVCVALAEEIRDYLRELLPKDPTT